MEKMYGYVRVSSRDQNEARQIIALDREKVPRKNIFTDKQSGKDFERPMYKKLIRTLRKDDVLFIKSIDRLGRNYQEILNQWQYITKTIGADIVVLDMPLLDTRNGKDLIGTFVSDIVLQILSFVSENERQNIRMRQKEGIDAAMKRGVSFGRPRSKRPAQYTAILHDYQTGNITSKEAAIQCSVSRSTFFRWLSEDGENGVKGSKISSYM